VPRYFFDIDDGERVIVDDVGTDLAGPEAARAEAVAALPSLARDRARDGQERFLTATVRTESGRTLCRATLALRVEQFGLSVVPR
jgi:hypothetical protein